MTDNRFWDEYTKKELLSLPKKDWHLDKSYSSILLVSTRKKHPSGFNLFVVVGCERGKPIEICGHMDDFRFGNICDDNNCYMDPFKVAIDCSMHGVFQIHSDGQYRIVVGHNLSTTGWWLEKEDKCKDKLWVVQ